MEKFLIFWSHNNAVIIEVLVGLILISTIYLVYRAVFGPKTLDTFDNAAGASVNTAHIEKTLQKILDQQSSAKPASGPAGAGSQTGPPAELVQELNLMKRALEDKEKQIVVLQDKAAAALKAAQAPNAPPTADAMAQAAQAAAGMAEKERTDYESKIKELEARLAEYEIISEDIADLSFFKEENARLAKELEALKSAMPTAAAPVTAAVTPPVVEAATVPKTPSLQATVTPQAPEPAVIDDALMAEFAKAVETQKSDSPAAAEAPKKDDNDKLLAEFENFNKKS